MADLKTEGRLDRIKGRIRQTWGDLTDDDMDQAKGNTENLVGRIKERTGESVDEIRRKLNELTDDNDNEEAHAPQ
ncbi:MAG TPA: CsbD family protein [Dehalococcoidia bacterium]|nr:CsbD family protein [Dehalococcoidia bacterium]